jgi:hypothetical protein
MRGLGAGLFVWAVVWIVYWFTKSYHAEVARENTPTLAIIAAVGASLLTAFQERSTHPQ